MMSRHCFRVFVLFLPFLSAFGLVGWISLPTMFILVIAPFILVQSIRKIIVPNRDYLLLALLIVGLLSSLLSPIGISVKTVSHFTGWSISILFFYLFVSWWIRSIRIGFDEISRIFMHAAFIAATGVYIDIILSNVFGYYLSDIIHYNFNEVDPTESFSGLLKRPRGFGAEPGFTAVVFEMLMPLAIYRVYKGGRIYFSVPYILYIVAAYLLLTSAASLVAILFAILIISLTFSSFNITGYIDIIKRSLLLLLLSLVSYFLWDYLGFYFENSIGIKVASVLDFSSIRFEIYVSLLKLFQHYPGIGIGFGSLSEAYNAGGLPVDLYGAGAINLFLEILVLGGIVGLLLFATFVLSTLKVLYKYRKLSHVRLLAISLISVLTHHIFISEPWFPMLWVLFALTSSVHYIVQNTSRYASLVFH